MSDQRGVQPLDYATPRRAEPRDPLSYYREPPALTQVPLWQVVAWVISCVVVSILLVWLVAWLMGAI